MPITVQEIYKQVISTLLPTERLQLATLILNSLVSKDTEVVDNRGAWTDQDRLDLTAFSLQYAATAFSEDEDVTHGL